MPFIVQTVQPTEEEQPKVVAGVYRPPGMRTKMAMSGAIKGKAPEINSEIAFPSLHAAVQDSKRLIFILLCLLMLFPLKYIKLNCYHCSV